MSLKHISIAWLFCITYLSLNCHSFNIPSPAFDLNTFFKLRELREDFSTNKLFDYVASVPTLDAKNLASWLTNEESVMQVDLMRNILTNVEKFDILHGSSLLSVQPLYLFSMIVVLVTASAYQVLQLNDENIGPYDGNAVTYNVDISEKFYNSKPGIVLKRLLRFSSITSAFNIKLLLDWKLNNIEKNQRVRAKEALILVNQLGPTFIKLGQALSIRTDLIPEAYALELRQLQDAVPPFDDEVARDIIKKELRVENLNEVFSNISSRPVASASIGQVYKGTLLDGRTVAVKVQRPNVLSEIALDLHLLRILAPIQVKLSNALRKRRTEQSDIDVALSLVDEWGRGFVAEVDYRLEANNQKQFIQAMKNRNLNAITAPAVIDEYSGPKVLVTEWVDGTRLDRDASPDVPRLCGVAVNAYLTMLLDTGVLHCEYVNT